MDVKAITFDAGGTLIRPYPSVGEIYAEVLARYGIKIDAQETENNFRTAFGQIRRLERNGVSEKAERDFWRELVGTVLGQFIPGDIFEDVFGELFDTFASSSRWQLAEDAKPVLIKLRKRGFRLAILSNADRRFRQVFQEMEITDLVEEVFLSSEIGFEKPDPRIFQHVEKKLGLTPRQILHIGDSLKHDIQGAAKANWHHLLLNDGPPKPETPYIKNLSELLNLLRIQYPKNYK